MKLKDIYLRDPLAFWAYIIKAATGAVGTASVLEEWPKWVTLLVLGLGAVANEAIIKLQQANNKQP